MNSKNYTFFWNLEYYLLLWSYLAGMNNFDAFAVNFGTDGSNIRHFMFDCRLHPSGPFDLMDLKKRLKRLKNTHLAPSGPFLILSIFVRI